MSTFVITTPKTNCRFNILAQQLDSIGEKRPIITIEGFEVYSWKINNDIIYVPFIVSNLGINNLYDRRNRIAECIKQLNITKESTLYVLLHIRDYFGSGDECKVNQNEFLGITNNVIVYKFHHGEPCCLADLWMEEDITSDFCERIIEHINENE